METRFYDNSAECRSIDLLLSEYVDNTLSARQVWEVEKHLATCAECAARCREMQMTVQMLRSAPQFDTGDDFMAKLHARLDGVEPEAVPLRSRLEVAREWMRGIGSALHGYRVPAFGLSLAAFGVVAVLLARKPLPAPPMPAPPVTGAARPAIAAEPLQKSVALSASNPFEDPAAANLEAHSALDESHAPAEGEAPNS